MAEPRLDHVGLAVRDLEAAVAWYCTAFGYADPLRFRVGPVDLDIVMLRHPSGFRLELLHRPGSGSIPHPADPAAAAVETAYGHVAFDVPDLKATFEHLVGIGAISVMTPRPSPEPRVEMAFVADPEGNLIELLSRNPEE